MTDMKTKLIKLKFKTALHYGGFGKPGLQDIEKYIASDTLYSAFCEISPTDIEMIYQLVSQNKVRVSDALPYVDNNLLVIKPIQGMTLEEDLEVDRTLYKKLNKIHFIPLEMYPRLITGASEELIRKVILLNEQIGVTQERTMNRLARDKQEAMPYVMTTFEFYEKSGLYLLVQYEDEAHFGFINKLIEKLGLMGIGGKRSSGLGKFLIDEISDFSLLDEGKYLLMATSLPTELKLDLHFNVLKRSGFYRGKRKFYKKRDLYAIQSGLLLETPFEGTILDNLSDHDKIYRFLVPMFVRIKI